MAPFTNHIYGTIMQVIYHLQNSAIHRQWFVNTHLKSQFWKYENSTNVWIYNFPQACHLSIARIYHPPYNKQVWNKFQVILWSKLQMTCRSLSTGMSVRSEKRGGGGPDRQQDNFTMLRMVRNPWLAMFKTSIKKALHDWTLQVGFSHFWTSCLHSICAWIAVNHSSCGVTVYLAIHLPALPPKVALFQGKFSFYAAENPNLCHCKDAFAHGFHEVHTQYTEAKPWCSVD
jgi:hypothetical protein